MCGVRGPAPRPARPVVEWFASQDETALHLSVLTLGELHTGIGRLAPGPRRNELRRWLTDEFVPRFGRRLLPVDAPVAVSRGRLAAAAERDGAPLPVIDGLLAATVQARGLTVVTRDNKHFARCGAAVFDPWRGS